MGPSKTVENYLKAILQAQIALGKRHALVPMGQLAVALGVVPGTATTMVKALAEAGLAHYEPYAGVRLTASGEKLAALVLRRHRLIELFLVKVMGMSWSEVHDEAENLEHAVSDRLIDLIDEMLGRPEVDPHGDPIPNPDGTLSQQEYDSLMTCPIGTPVTIARVSDQDPAFLQFAETNELRPGDVVQVEARSEEGDSVELLGRDDRRVTIGARAASKVLVHALAALIGASLVVAHRRRTNAGIKVRTVPNHRQLVSGRGGLQPGDRRLSEHLRRAAAPGPMGLDVHAGVAARFRDESVFVHGDSSEQRRSHRRW